MGDFDRLCKILEHLLPPPLHERNDAHLSLLMIINQVNIYKAFDTYLVVNKVNSMKIKIYKPYKTLIQSHLKSLNHTS